MSMSLPINRLFKEPLATISELRVRSISLTTPSGIVQVVVEATNKIPKGGMEQELFFLKFTVRCRPNEASHYENRAPGRHKRQRVGCGAFPVDRHDFHGKFC